MGRWWISVNCCSQGIFGGENERIDEGIGYGIGGKTSKFKTANVFTASPTKLLLSLNNLREWHPRLPRSSKQKSRTHTLFIAFFLQSIMMISPNFLTYAELSGIIRVHVCFITPD